jgi:hypothetical protein
MRTTFKKQAAFVRRCFFPAWDRRQQWKIVQVDALDGAHGRCDRGRKTVSILKGIGGDNLTATLIHEIAHAVTDDHHGKRWQQRMEMAAVRADYLGLVTVANGLRMEIAGYRDDGLRVTAALIYSGITDCVLDSPSVKFTHVVEFVRRGYGLPRDKFLKRFRRARKVFEQAKTDAKHSTQAKARLLAMK